MGGRTAEAKVSFRLRKMRKRKIRMIRKRKHVLGITCGGTWFGIGGNSKRESKRTVAAERFGIR